MPPEQRFITKEHIAVHAYLMFKQQGKPVSFQILCYPYNKPTVMPEVLHLISNACMTGKCKLTQCHYTHYGRCYTKKLKSSITFLKYSINN